MGKRLRTHTATRDLARASCLVASGAITVERACESKHKYDTQRQARAAAKTVAQEIGRPVATYHCAFCRGHHLTKVRHGEESRAE